MLPLLAFFADFQTLFRKGKGKASQSCHHKTSGEKEGSREVTAAFDQCTWPAARVSASQLFSFHCLQKLRSTVSGFCTGKIEKSLVQNLAQIFCLCFWLCTLLDVIFSKQFLVPRLQVGGNLRIFSLCCFVAFYGFLSCKQQVLIPGLQGHILCE